jgi:hypothetical protein
VRHQQRRNPEGGDPVSRSRSAFGEQRVEWREEGAGGVTLARRCQSSATDAES